MSHSSSSYGIALITGGAKRIGRVLALYLASRGYDIALHVHHSYDEGKVLANDIEQTYPGRICQVLQADLADEEAVKMLIFHAQEMLGGVVTVLINNASVFANDDVMTMTSEGFNKHWRVNLYAPLVLSQQFAKVLPQNMEGNIVHMLDYAVWNLPPSFFSYIISKSALWTATQTMALQLAPRIRVNAIGPGHVLPNQKETDASFAQAVAQTPLKQPVSPETIANAVGYILESPALTGHMIPLDGGKHLLGASFY